MLSARSSLIDCSPRSDTCNTSARSRGCKPADMEARCSPCGDPVKRSGDPVKRSSRRSRKSCPQGRWSVARTPATKWTDGDERTRGRRGVTDAIRAPRNRDPREAEAGPLVSYFHRARRGWPCRCCHRPFWIKSLLSGTSSGFPGTDGDLRPCSWRLGRRARLPQGARIAAGGGARGPNPPGRSGPPRTGPSCTRRGAPGRSPPATWCRATSRGS